MTYLVSKYSTILDRIVRLTRSCSASFVTKSLVLRRYYTINDLIWQDGLLIDFLQKKTADRWIRQFLVLSSYIVSERIVFSMVTRFYIDLVIWPVTDSLPFDFSNVSTLFVATLTTVVVSLLLLNLSYLYILMCA